MNTYDDNDSGNNNNMKETEDGLTNIVRLEGETSSSSSPTTPTSSELGTLFLDGVGEVTLSLNSDGLSWDSLDPSYIDEPTCLGIKITPRLSKEVKFCDVYGVELIDYGPIHGFKHPIAKHCFLSRASHDSKMYRFSVHGVQKSQNQPCLLIPVSHTFGHKDLQTCQMWVDQIMGILSREASRPKRLLVFVHPMSGKGNGRKNWAMVAPIFSRAKVDTKVIVTERAGHAFDVMASISKKELNSYDGAIAVGGDGFFNEILNGFLLSRHKAPYPPSPSDIVRSGEGDSNVSVPDPNKTDSENANQNEDHSPLLLSSAHDGSALANFCPEEGSSGTDQDFNFPLEWFRFGIIPAGSTDAIVMCTTGTRDPLTSALHILLGKRVSLDIAHVVRWRATCSSDVEPFARYAASFAGYGFYGDVITESEQYRWMGPKRYDYAGTKVFLEHRSYEAEVAYVETESEKEHPTADKGHLLSRVRAMVSPDKSERRVCRTNCNVCNKKPSTRSHRVAPYSCQEDTKWKRCKGRFISIGAAIISNRNERAPDGLVADAHLSDGFLHLLLIRDCPRALYLWHLTQLATKGGTPLNFEFVEHYKTPAFTFTSSGDESVWNLDGEIFPAHQLSAQVFRGLVSLFASGPEV